MASVCPEIRLFIKERNVTALAEIVKLADNWSMARGGHKRSIDKIKTKVNVPGLDTSTDIKPPRRDYSNVKCQSCGEFGHIKLKCPKDPLAYSKHSTSNISKDVKINFCLEDDTLKDFMSCGTVSGSRVSTILRDTGCSCVIVANEVLPDHDNPLRFVKVFDFLGRENSFPVFKCYITCPFYNGWVEAVRAPLKFFSVLVGNIPGVTDVIKDFGKAPNDHAVHVATRSSSKVKSQHPLKVTALDPLKVSPAEFAELQSNCKTLSDVREKSLLNECVNTKDGSSFKYVGLNKLYYRECVNSRTKANIGRKALIFPYDCRLKVLFLAHESPFASHFSNRKTELRVRETFFWPGMSKDIKNYCRSCDRCQRVSSKGRVRNVPLMKMPIITEPFSRVAIDIVGPLSPVSSAGHSHILTQ